MNLLQRIKQVSVICPDNIAIVDQAKSVSYAEIEAQSNAIAHRVAALNRNGDLNCVAILLPRSAEVVLSYLGIIKSGACVLCLDDSSISCRDLDNIQFCAPHTIITTREELERFPDVAALSCNKMLLDEETWSQEDRMPIDYSAEDRPVHITFTSGTTGRAKCVVYSLRNFSHIVMPNLQQNTPLDPNLRKACVMNMSYTMGMLGVLMPMMVGGTAYIASSHLLNNIPALAQFARENRINRIILPNSVVPILLQEPNHGITHILSSCERLEGVTPKQLEGIRLENFYGATECGRITRYQVTGNETVIPIGTAEEQVSVFLLDENMVPVKQGKIGMIYAASPGVALGYLRDDQLTRECFLPCPFLPGQKMYRTGDYAYKNSDHQLIYCGRQDSVVKVRGYRIHLGEIENTVLTLRKVRKAAAKLFDDQYLCVFYCGDETPEAILNYLNHRLPSYMLPHRIIRQDSLPMGANGKVDRTRLEKPAYEISVTATSFASEREHILCQTMAQVLGAETESVDPQADFFTVGGDSLRAMQWVASLPKLALSIDLIYKYRSPREIARHIDEMGASINKSSDEQARRQWQPFNTMMQDILAYQQVYPDSPMWNVSQLYRLPDDIDIPHLKNALRQVCSNHPAMSSQVVEQEGRYGLCYQSDWQPEIEEVYVQKAVNEYIRGCSYNFDIFAARPLYNIYIMHAADGCFLYIIGHHLILDATSFVILHHEIEQAYRGEALERDYFFSYLQQQSESRLLPEYQAVHQSMQKLIPSTGYQTSIPAAYHDGGNLLSVYHHPLSLGSTPDNTKLIVAVMQAVAQMTGCSKVRLNWTFHNRMLKIYSHSVGAFLRTYSVAADTSLPYEVWMRAVQTQIERQISNSKYDFSVCSEVDIPFVSDPIEVNHLLTVQHTNEEADPLLIPISSVPTNRAMSVQIELQLAMVEDKMELLLWYMGNRYNQDSIRQFCQHIESVLHS